ncbi:uncharacterized protein LOC130805709 [Amaranthus tricolor]|uniref:uncharacterized protein LOC130805709 n=1 Tax=Amaranthus tricolor TaxID=29722 RepID=UPI00258EAF0F|nr:uncharacterized protein LOC130805709 [Amaranthus tricolor]
MEYIKQYKWDPRLEPFVRRSWEEKAAKRYADMLFKWRRTLKSEPEFKPPSINNETWARWKADWKRPDNKAVSASNSSNRHGGKDKAEATHIGGSIPHARTMRDLEQSKGQRPTAYEIFTRTHGVFDNEIGDCSQWTNSK